MQQVRLVCEISLTVLRFAAIKPFLPLCFQFGSKNPAPRNPISLASNKPAECQRATSQSLGSLFSTICLLESEFSENLTSTQIYAAPNTETINVQIKIISQTVKSSGQHFFVCEL